MAPKAETKSLVSTPVLLVVAFGIAIAGGIWYLERGGAGAAQGPSITAEGKAYTRNLKLSDVGMKATENAIHQQVVEIVGKITNAGERELKSVSVQCIFMDAYGQAVSRERVEIVRAKFGGLKPGETRSFRLPFDNLPANWNQGMPQLVIAEVIFG